MLKSILNVAAAFSLLAAFNVLAASEESQDNVEPQSEIQSSTFPEQPYNSGWSFSFDNDIIVQAGDQDYTGGIAYAMSGRRAKEVWWSIDKLRAGADRLVHFPKLYGSRENFKLHTIEAGFILFTPSDLEIAEPIQGDHPYASLFFVVNSEQTVVPSTKTAFTSALTVGVLGARLGGEVQKGIHKIIGAERPRGWSNQISEGGEPTFKYTAGLQKTVVERAVGRSGKMELKLTGEANVGMTTDAGTGFNVRIGRLSTPWWGFNPHQAEYVNLGAPVSLDQRSRNSRDFFLYLGGSVKLRAYNAVLQGQFRDSVVSYDRSELETTVWEAWAGVSYERKSGLNISGFIRTRSAELDLPGAREPTWGGFVFSKAF